MRKSVPFLLLTLLTSLFFLSSCERRLNNDSYISFEAESLGPDELEEETKGGVANISTVQTNGFRVSAYPTNGDWGSLENVNALPNIMYNQPVSYTTTWGYSPLQLWPITGKVSFFAYSPFVESVTTLYSNTAKGRPKILFTTPYAVSSQIDLLYAQKMNMTSSDGKVKFDFKHALSCIGFKAKKSSDCNDNTIIITKLQIGFVENVVRRRMVYQFNNIDGSPGTWSLPTNPDISLDYFKASAGHGGTLYDISTGKTLPNNTATALQINDDDKYLMIIPQTLPQESLILTITYSVDGASNTKEVRLPKAELGITIGNKYTYTLIVSADKIVYDAPEVVTWPTSSISNSVKETVQTIVTNEISNCYIINRGEGMFDYNASTVKTVFRFPAIHRVNQFWGESTTDGYPGGRRGDGGEIYTVPSNFKDYTNGDGCIVVGNSKFAIQKDSTWYAQVIWSDISGIDNDTGSLMTIKQTATNPGRDIEYLEVTFKPGNYSGNVVIGVTRGVKYDAGTKFEKQLKYLWSWHLWVTNYNPETQYIMMNVSNQSTPTPYKVMDRNLGAKDELGDGLYYQWGRKDPFCNPSSVYPNRISLDGSMGMVQMNNTTTPWLTLIDCVFRPNCRITGRGGDGDDVVQTGFLSANITTPLEERGYNRWGGAKAHNDRISSKNAKTIYDPCPPGWRMPWGGNWSGITSSTPFAWSNQIGYIGRVFTGITTANSSTPNLFKASGFMDSSNQAPQNVGTDGYYWGGSPSITTPDPYQGRVLFLNATGNPYNPDTKRENANTIRCVKHQ